MGLTAIIRFKHIIATLMLLTAALSLVAAGADAADNKTAEDRFVEGYITGIVEAVLDAGPAGCSVEMSGGRATVTLYGADEGTAETVRDSLEAKPRLDGLDITVKRGPAAEGRLVPRDLRDMDFCDPDADGGGCWLPEGDVFRSLVADPKQPRFFVSLNSYDSSVERYTMGSVGFGETFGLYRWNDPSTYGRIQGGISGGLFAQFNMDAESMDLVNGDYVIGFPFTWELGRSSARVRLYHQSSHLGDEYLLRVKPQRVNLSFESVEVMYAFSPGDLRFYGGGEWLIHREPSDLDRLSAHFGADYVRSEPLIWGLRPVAGADFKCFEEHDWKVDTCLKAGVMFGENEPGRTNLRLMGKWYRGFSPHGQFYPNEVEMYGIELWLGF